VAVVTGGASGIGEATCHHLAARGHQVAVIDLDSEGARRVVKDLRAGGAQALALAADVTDRAALDAAFAEIRSVLGPAEILVTSAGLVAFDAFGRITPQR
jgi:2-hydroxycyclohexanecarboxyl-CoA dehydrogenase